MSSTSTRTSLAKRLTAPVVLGLLIAAGSSAAARQGGTPSRDPYADLPGTLTLNTTVRDFRAQSQQGGHTDFQRSVSGLRIGLVNDRLDADGKPTLKSTTGQTINTQWTDSAGRPISPYYFDTASGDRAGRASNASSAAIQSAQSFSQWYRDTAGVNSTVSKPLTLVRTPNTNRYVFDSATHEPWKTRGGYFPINGELFGNFANNSRGVNSNFHFTSELETTFVFERGTNQVFTFTGDDDVWVFIDGRLVIDVGGVHARVEQSVNLDRLSWLQSGRRYSLKVFHAERFTVESNFRIETTIKLDPVPRPANTNLQD